MERERVREREKKREKQCHDNVKCKYSPHIPQDFNLPKFAASSKAFILYQWVGKVEPSVM